MQMITKADIMLVRSLSDKRARVESGLFAAEGEKLVGELLASDFRVRRVFLRGDSALFSARMSQGMDPEVVSAKEMERMSHLKTPSPALALAEIPRYPLPARPGEELTLALDGVQDPGNMGTIIRLADWFGIRDILCSPDTADCFNPKVVQATMGALLRVRVHYGDLPSLLAAARCGRKNTAVQGPAGADPGNGAGIPVYGTFLEGENIYAADLGKSPVGILVMGNEGKGVSAPVAAAVTRKLFIPPYPAGEPSSESLNVAVATAIACSELRRRS